MKILSNVMHAMPHNDDDDDAPLTKYTYQVFSDAINIMLILSLDKCLNGVIGY